MKSLVWFISGASCGFGRETARAALKRCDAVLAAARDPKVLERGNLLKGGAVNDNDS